MCNKGLIFAFLGGAVVGAGAALLFAPQKGEDLRDQIKMLCRKYGIYKTKAEADVDHLVDEIAAEMEIASK